LESRNGFPLPSGLTVNPLFQGRETSLGVLPKWINDILNLAYKFFYYITTLIIYILHYDITCYHSIPPVPYKNGFAGFHFIESSGLTFPPPKYNIIIYKKI